MKKSFPEIADILETWLGAAAFIAMFLAIVLQVFSRYVLNNPLVWPFELSVFCYIYVIYVGAIVAARRQSHISFDLLYQRLPEHPKCLVGILTNLFISLIFIATLPSSFEYIRIVGGVPSSALSIPWGAVLAAFPFSMGAIALILLLRACSDTMKLLRTGGQG
jgi:TRAP-type C4-dicarboxylate transport system permease small subunit